MNTLPLTIPSNKQLHWIITVYAVVIFCGLIHPFHLHPLRNFYHDLITVAALVAGIGSFGILLKRTAFSVPGTVVVPVGLLIIVSLQLWNGMILQPADVLYPIVDFACLTLAMIFGATVAARPDAIEIFCTVIARMWVVFGLISFIFQLIQLSGIDAWPIVMTAVDRHVLRPYGSFGQPNLMALHLCFALLATWWMYTVGKLRQVTGVVIALALLCGITLTQSRTMWITLPVTAVGCGFAVPGYRQISKKYLFGWLAVFALMVVAAPYLTSLIGAPIESIAERAGQTSERIVLWKEAFAMSLAHPWFGVGWLQFGVNQVTTAVLFPPSGLSDYAHNIVLNFAAELGWPVTIAIFVGAVWWFWTSCITRWRDPQIRFLSFLLLAVLLHSMVEFPLWNTYVLVPFGVVVGVAHLRAAGLREIQIGRLAVACFVVVSATVMTFAAWDYNRVVNGFRTLVREAKMEDMTERPRYMPAFTVFPQFFDYLNVNKVKVYPGMPQSDIRFLEKMALSFGFPPLLERLALAYALNKRPTEAVMVLTAEQRLHVNYYPTTFAMWSDLAQRDPAMFGAIFNHIPVPQTGPIAGALKARHGAVAH